MNKVVVGAIAVAVVAGAGVGATAWSGAKISKELHDQTASVLGQFPALKIVSHTTTKGLFSSTHEVTLQIGCAPQADAAADGATPPKPLQITWRDHVQHGPLPGGRNFGLAVITSELVLPAGIPAELSKMLGNQSPLTVRTVLGYAGGYTSEINSPVLKYAEQGKGQFEWLGIKAVVRGSLTGGLAAGGTYNIEMPGFNLDIAKTERAPGGSIKLGRIEASGEATPYADASVWLRPSKGSGSVASMAFNFERPLQDGSPAQPMTVAFDGLKFSSETSIDKGLVSATSQFSGKARVDDFAIERIELQASLRRLHAATYQKFISRAMSSAMSCDKNAEAALQQSLMADLQKDLGTLLQANPEYGVDKFAVVIAGKRAEMSFKVGVRGISADDTKAPPMMLAMTKGYFDANASMHTGVIEQVVKKIASLQPAPTAASAPEAAASAAEAQASTALMMMAVANQYINEGVEKGTVVRDGDTIKANAKYENGQMLLNGKPMAGMGGGQ
jgi:uncharacterized protein YdgA (DUF945 family)